MIPFIKNAYSTSILNFREAHSQKLDGDRSSTLQIQGTEKAHHLARSFISVRQPSFSEIFYIAKEKFLTCFSHNKLDDASTRYKELETRLLKSLSKDLMHLASLTSEQVAPINSVYRSTGIKDDYRLILTAQLLAISLSARSFVEGKTFLLPVEVNGQFEIREYSADRFHLQGKLPVVTLKSDADDAPSWMIFRGVSLLLGIKDGAAHSIKTCLTRSEGLNLKPVMESSATLRRHIHQLRTCSTGKQKPLYIAGHSLGAILGTAVRFLFPDDVSKAFCFGSPGACDVLAALHGAEKGLHLEVFNTDKDPIPSAGKHVIGNVYNVRVDCTEAPKDYHTMWSLLFPHSICKVSNTNDSGKTSRKLIEKARSLPSNLHRFVSRKLHQSAARLRNAL